MNDAFRAAFTRYLFEEAGSSGRGTVSTYLRALEVLSKALTNAGHPEFADDTIWEKASPRQLMELRRIVVEEQKKYVESGSGLFATLKTGGRSYYEKRWCSAALQKLAAFLETGRYVKVLDEVLSSSDAGGEIARLADKAALSTTECFLPDNIAPRSQEGREVVAATKRRLNESVFRSWIVRIYGGQCCVTGLNVPELLRASHIVEWSKDAKNRMNPSNGLCLSATYDAAFDRHLISFDADYRMVLSKRISDFCDNQACREYFKQYEGRRIVLPSRFLPDPALLEIHRNQLVS